MSKPELKTIEQIYQGGNQGVFMNGKIRVINAKTPQDAIKIIMELSKKTGKPVEIFVKQGIRMNNKKITQEDLINYIVLNNSQVIVYFSDEESKVDYIETLNDLNFVMRDVVRQSGMQLSNVTVNPDGSID